MPDPETPATAARGEELYCEFTSSLAIDWRMYREDTWWHELEDIHMNVEARLFKLICELAGRLHTARSRNDQVETDGRLYTHLQKTQPISFCHVLMVYYEMLYVAHPTAGISQVHEYEGSCYVDSSLNFVGDN